MVFCLTESESQTEYSLSSCVWLLDEVFPLSLQEANNRNALKIVTGKNMDLFIAFYAYLMGCIDVLYLNLLFLYDRQCLLIF